MEKTSDNKFNIVWVAWMSRWNEPSPDHAYAVGVYDDPYIAKKNGELEASFRGGKYSYQHTPAYVDMVGPPRSNMLAEPNIIDSVLVAWVTSINEYWSAADNITHFLGCFTSIERAEEYKNKLYPGWKLYTRGFKVESDESLMDDPDAIREEDI